MKFLCRIFLLCLVLGAAVAASDKRTLVLLSNNNAKDNYSKYLKSLRDLGYTLVIRGHLDNSLSLQEYGTYNYENLVLLAPEADGFGGSVNLQSILEFVDAGKNVILAASPSSSPLIRKLASELGVELKEKDSKVYDHFSSVVSDSGAVDPTRIFSSEFVKSNIILGDEPLAPVLFRGIASTVPSDSELAIVALSAPATAYSKRAGAAADAVDAVGRANALVVLAQMRNNARVLVSGSLDLFSNAFFTASVPSPSTGASVGSGNRAFCAAASRWVFQGAGALHLGLARHRVLPTAETADGRGNTDAASNPAGEFAPAMYVVGQEVEFSVDIFRKASAGEGEGGDRLVPVTEPLEGLQVEFTMLSPFVRLPLEPVGNGTFALRFRVPDVYGVFKYVISYNRVGLSRLELQLQVPVRPYKHDEYERFLTCAGPYYASAASSVIAFIALGWAFLYHKSA